MGLNKFMVKISIVIPVYNCEKFLSKSLDSIFNQPFKDIEVICVNDGSTDDSLRILEEYSEKYDRLKYISQENQGAAVARNNGLKLANGEYTLHFDPDDWYENNIFEDLYNHAKNNDSDMVLFNSVEHKNNGKTHERIYIPLSYDSSIDYDNFTFDYKFYNKNLALNSFFTVWSKLYKTSFLKENNISFDEIRIYDDMTYNVKTTLLAKKISYYPKILYNYNKLNENSIQSGTLDKKAFVIIDVYKNIERFLKEYGFYEELEFNFLTSKFGSYNVALERISSEYKEELFNLYKEEFMNLKPTDKNVLKRISINFYSFYIHIINSDSYEEFSKYHYINDIKNLDNKSIYNRPSPENSYIEKYSHTIREIKKYELFDEEFYKNEYNYNGDLNPLLDYLIEGYKEGKNPCEKFDGKYYTDFNKNVRNSNPLDYFVNYGIYEGKIKFNEDIYNPKSINKFETDKDIEKFMNSEEYGINKEERSEKYIISLTSFPERMYDIHYCLYSLLTQSFKADKIILWLAEEEFPNKEKDIPQKILNLRNKGLTIKWCKNIYSYKKLIPSLKEYPNCNIITVDDDLFYNKNMLKNLYEMHLKYPNDIISSRCRKISFNKDGSFDKYENWKLCYNEQASSFTNFFTGGSGTLYPPDSLDENVLNIELFTELCPKADDIWFWSMAILNGTKIKSIEKPIVNILQVNPFRSYTNELTLWKYNENGGNMKQLKNILNEFPEIKEIIKNEKISKTSD